MKGKYARGDRCRRTFPEVFEVEIIEEQVNEAELSDEP
jgi:hypothetical protein